MSLNEFYEDELEEVLLKSCTFISLNFDTQLKMHNIVILMLQEQRVMDFFKQTLSCDTAFEVLKIFFQYSPELAKNKAISNFVTKNKAKLGKIR